MSRRFKIFALAMAIALTAALVPAAIMAFGGETQSYMVAYDSNADGTPESIESWTYTAIDNGDGTYTSTATFNPPISGTAGQARTKVVFGNPMALELIGTDVTRDQTTQLAQVSNATTNMGPATTTHTYTPIVGTLGDRTAGNSWGIARAIASTMSWAETWTVAVNGPVTVDAGGQALAVPCMELVYTLNTSTSPLGPPPLGLNVPYTYEYWPASGLSIEPMVMLELGTWMGAEYRQTVGGTPTPPFPEVATVVLLSMGLVALGGVVLFKRRRASLTAA